MKPKQMTRAWLEEAIRAKPAKPLFPPDAMQIARAWARRMRKLRSVQS